MSKKKQKKEKVTYIDDGITIADMSAFSNKRKMDTGKDNFLRPQSTFGDRWKTYWSAVKSMLVPMFITLGVLTVLFLITYASLGGFSQ